MKLGFVVMTEFLKHQQVYTLLQLINAAKAKGHTVAGVFFFGTGVLNIQKKGHLGKGTRNIPESISALTKVGIPMYACQTWADNYAIFNEDAVDGTKVMGLGELAALTAEADKLVVFGSHT